MTRPLVAVFGAMGRQAGSVARALLAVADIGPIVAGRRRLSSTIQENFP